VAGARAYLALLGTHDLGFSFEPMSELPIVRVTFALPYCVGSVENNFMGRTVGGFHPRKMVLSSTRWSRLAVGPGR
jgi:hypothetical protein